MILYDNKGADFFFNLFKRKGSVFPKAMSLAVPNAAISMTFVYLINSGKLNHFKDKDSVLSNNSVWGGFSFAIGFLVIFRTSQAYSRFWEGCTNMHKMGAEWYDACAALMAFTKHTEKPMHEVLKFQNMLVRLFSMLHSAACGEIEEVVSILHPHHVVGSYQMELIDAQSLSDEALLAVQKCDAKTEMIMQWIQQFIISNIKTGILSVPPPILSRSFQEIASGMVHFNEAMKIANVPFPFPYAQTCDALLILHWMAVPFIISQWVAKPWWAGAFAFIMIFTMWTLNFIAIELENPFGKDANDIDGPGMQRDMNTHLRVLLREETWKTPILKCDEEPTDDPVEEQEMLRSRAIGYDEDSFRSFAQIWKIMHNRSSQQSDDWSAPQVPVTRARATVMPGVAQQKAEKSKMIRRGPTNDDVSKARTSGGQLERVSVQDDSFSLKPKHVDSNAQAVQSMNEPAMSDVQSESPREESVDQESNEATLLGRDQSRNSSSGPENLARPPVVTMDTKRKVVPAGRNQPPPPQTAAYAQPPPPQTAATILHGQDRSLDGNAILENAGRPFVASMDQGPTMFSNSPGYDQGMYSIPSSPSSPSRLSKKGLSIQVPHLLPRVLAERTAVTPRGPLTPLPVVSEDEALQITQRLQLGADTVSLTPRSSYDAAGLPPPTQRSSYKAPSPSTDALPPTQRSSYKAAGPPADGAAPTQRSSYSSVSPPKAPPADAAALTQRSPQITASSAANATAATQSSSYDAPGPPADEQLSAQIMLYNAGGHSADTTPSMNRSSYSAAASPKMSSNTSAPTSPLFKIPTRPSQTGMGSFTSCMS